MKIAELRKKNKSELSKLLREKREQVRKLRFDLVAGKLKDHRAIRRIKKDIARILTLLRKEALNSKS